MYGNASEIVTELTKGSTGDILEMTSTVPQWATPAGSSAVFELIDFTQVTSSTTTIDTTFSNIDGGDMAELYVVCSGCNGGFDIDVQIYDENSALLTSANYSSHGYTIISGTQTIINSSGDTAWKVGYGSIDPYLTIMHISLGKCGGGGVAYFPRMQSQTVGTSGVTHIGGVFNYGTKATGISGIKFGVSGSNAIENGTYMAIYQVKNV